MRPTSLGGSFTLGKSSLTVNRMGYGAMQLAGPQVWGPPRDPDRAVRVLREAVEAGVNHIDTSDFYGPHVTNQIIKQALHPYPNGLVIVTNERLASTRRAIRPGHARVLSACLRYSRAASAAMFMPLILVCVSVRRTKSCLCGLAVLDLAMAWNV
jgi:predicted aldo/keto reductase-like oxidoreductase